MALQFYFGPSGSGKSKRLHQDVLHMAAKDQTGYGRKPVLDDTGKSLVLRKVASSVKENLPVLSGNLNKIGYIHEIKSAISWYLSTYSS